MYVASLGVCVCVSVCAFIPYLPCRSLGDGEVALSSPSPDKSQIRRERKRERGASVCLRVCECACVRNGTGEIASLVCSCVCVCHLMLLCVKRGCGFVKKGTSLRVIRVNDVKVARQ